MKTDPVDNEIIRLGTTLPKVGKTMSIGLPFELDLNPYQRSALEVMAGKGAGGVERKKLMEGFIMSPDYKTIPDEYKKDRLEMMFRRTQDSAKRLLLMQDQSLQDQVKKKMRALERTNQGATP